MPKQSSIKKTCFVKLPEGEVKFTGIWTRHEVDVAYALMRKNLGEHLKSSRE